MMICTCKCPTIHRAWIHDLFEIALYARTRNCGEVVELGEGVRGWNVGDSIVGAAGVGCELLAVRSPTQPVQTPAACVPGLATTEVWPEFVNLRQELLVDRG